MQCSWKLTLMRNIKQTQMLLLLFLFKLQMENIEEASKCWLSGSVGSYGRKSESWVLASIPKSQFFPVYMITIYEKVSCPHMYGQLFLLFSIFISSFSLWNTSFHFVYHQAEDSFLIPNQIHIVRKTTD